MTIDWWTLGLQTLNVLILIWLLQHFFWRPVAAMIEQRRAAAQGMLAEAETKRHDAATALAEIEKTRAGFAKERESILAAAHEAAEQARAARLTEALSEANAFKAAARQEIETEKQAAEKDWTERASQLALDIATRLAARLDGAAVRTSFLNWLLAEIKGLPEATRQAVAGNGISLEAIAAAPLAPADQEHYRQLIGEAFGGNPRINFAVDPALIAGLELRGPHLLVTNSWRADLGQILGDILHADKS